MKEIRKLEKRYRPEIEGLRIVAILLVVIYHFWLGRVSGGIDVFFVLTGFLMTLSLISRIERNNEIKVGKFWLDLLKRLLPQALTVMLVTVFVAIFILPETQWMQTLKHLLAAMFYYENWQLAKEAVDYLALEREVSVFQHFWSLSVQGQMYLLWPIIMLISYFLISKVFKVSLRRAAIALLIAVFIVSITYSIYKTNTDQAWAYFDTFARIWEFSIGGLFALLLPYLKMPKMISLIGGWLGLLIICFTGIVLQVSTVFPGYMALVPISGALLVLMASENSSKLGVDKFLSIKPLIFLGGLSYGVYLWHWPILRFYLTYFDTLEVPLVHGLIMMGLTIVLAYLSTRLIEEPIRRFKPREWKTKGIVIAMTFAVMFIGVYSYYAKELQPVEVSGDRDIHLGAAADIKEAAPERIEDIEFIPPVITVADDIPSFYSEKDCFVYNSPDVKKCSYGATENPDFTVALVGGSHSGHWFPALEILAEEMNFQLDLYNHDGCRFSAPDAQFNLSENCMKWNDNLVEILKENPPDLVFTTSTLNNRETIPSGYIEQWTKMEGYSTIFAIRDNPRMNEDIPTCLATKEFVTDCGVDRAEALSVNLPWEHTEGIPSNVVFSDLTDYFCTDDRCEAVIGNIIVYRDQHHLTASYVETLAPYLKDELQRAFDQITFNQTNQTEIIQ